jgi:phospholipid/cholesterol/gamma-HCH transport system substrate-binding protein
LAKINGGQGTLGKLVSDDSLYVNLNHASQELDLLLEDLRLNPNRYFSVFGKKDKLPKLSDSDVERIQRAMQNAPAK